MHELSIALAIVDAASEEAERLGGISVCAIHVRLGGLAGIVKDALLSAFELAREASPLQNSRLVVEDVPVIVYCDRCRAERPIDSVQSFRCSSCGSPPAELISGKELEISALEIEE
jgi:hydrogenase nickel incorporation protein HypA/HybF